MICPGILRETSSDESRFEGYSNSLNGLMNGATVINEEVFCSENTKWDETFAGPFPDSGSENAVGLRVLLRR